MTAPHAVLNKLPVLATPKRPGLAAVIGILTGGIGLAIYFRSVRDLFPVELVGGLVILGSVIAGTDPLQIAGIVAPVVGGLYGFLRARTSNRRLATAITPPVAVAAAS